MALLAWIALGLVAGLLANKLVKTTGSGLAADVWAGIVGAVVGGLFFARILIGQSDLGLDPGSMACALIGAALVLTAYNRIMTD